MPTASTAMVIGKGAVRAYGEAIGDAGRGGARCRRSVQACAAKLDVG